MNNQTDPLIINESQSNEVSSVIATDKKKSFFEKFTDLFVNTNEIEEGKENEKEIDKKDSSENKKQSIAIKKFSIIKSLLKKKKLNEYTKFYKKYMDDMSKNQTIKNKLKTLFNINSDFMVIWKVLFKLFYVVVIYMIFLKYILVDFSFESYNHSKRMKFFYQLINLMFLFDLIFGLMIIIFNGGSKLTYLKLPLKIYNCIPFSLKHRFLLFPKFIRIDVFNKLFNFLESFINDRLIREVNNYYTKIFLIYTNKMVSYLLVFFCYGYITSCFLSFFNNLSLIANIYYTIETFCTIGFGEINHKEINSIIIVILDLYIGIYLFAVMTMNIRYLSKKIYEFNRETSFKEQFDFLSLQMTKSTGKPLPKYKKNKMHSSLLFNSDFYYGIIKNEFSYLYPNLHYSINKEIKIKLFSNLANEFECFFDGIESNFIYNIFECLKPKIYKKGKEIIKIGQNVNNLIFIIRGIINVVDNNKNLIYTTKNAAIHGDFEFITDLKSEFSVKINETNIACGFLLRKNDFLKIINYSENQKVAKFIKYIYHKRKLHLKWKNTINNNEKKK